ncbi:MAG: PGF-pre-PGF domain-containing protein, partial [ANME-2 cluster archaeon]|nr:PGF-pre-PGF domain-containing protein [ANME-2 cluster archaeon]
FNIGTSGDENQVDGSTAEVPTDATIKNATLYVYYTYRKSATGPNPGVDPRPDYEMSINGGSILTTDDYYTDIKGFITSEYQYGTLVYDVTANVTGNGAYQAVRSNCNNTDPVLKGKGYVSGMALMIIYDDGSDNTYAIDHGYDRLATSYKTEYNVLPEDATTTATLTDVDPNLIATANMLTVTVDAVASGSESQQFNTGSWEVGAWDCIAGVPDCGWNYPLGINRGAVDKSDITASGTDEVVKFQERTSNGFAPVFACLQTRAPDPTPPSNGGSGGSGGGGASGELYGNIASSETNRQYVNQNSDISYSFELECNIVQFVKFTSLKSAGKIATKVEILKDTSALVDNPPLDIVYKNLNIWVGNAGWGTKRNIADATVVFTVDKSWITENNIDETSIALYRYSDDTWHELVTRKISEDSNSLQFEAETPGFSPFAVTGKEFEEELGGEGIIPEPTVTAETTPTPTDDGGIPGFSLFAGLSILLIAVQLLRKK